MPYKDADIQRAYQAARVRKIRALYFANKSCVQCGSIEALELDHIDPSTKVTHKIWSWSQHRRDEELKKCQVLCYDCHKKKSGSYCAVLFTKEIEHGTSKAYKYKFCRCNLCKFAYSIYKTLRSRLTERQEALTL